MLFGIVAIAAAVSLAALVGIAGLSGGGVHLQPAFGIRVPGGMPAVGAESALFESRRKQRQVFTHRAGQAVVRRADGEVDFTASLDQPHLDFLLRRADSSSLMSRATAGAFGGSGGAAVRGVSAGCSGFRGMAGSGSCEAAHFVRALACSGVAARSAVGVLFRRVLRCHSRGARFGVAGCSISSCCAVNFCRAVSAPVPDAIGSTRCFAETSRAPNARGALPGSGAGSRGPGALAGEGSQDAALSTARGFERAGLGIAAASCCGGSTGSAAPVSGAILVRRDNVRLFPNRRFRRRRRWIVVLHGRPWRILRLIADDHFRRVFAGSTGRVAV